MNIKTIMSCWNHDNFYSKINLNKLETFKLILNKFSWNL